MLNSHQKSHKNNKGLTLLELLITIAIAAILLAIVVPSFRSVFISSNVDSTYLQLAADIAKLRSEAIKRNKHAVLCASDDGAKCNSADFNLGTFAQWQGGYIGFLRSYGNVTSTEIPPLATGDEIVLIRDSLGSTALAFNHGDMLKFDSSGVSSAASDVNFAICGADDNQGSKKLTMLMSGQVYTGVLSSTDYNCQSAS